MGKVNFCRFYGAKSLKVAMSYHLVARADSCKGDFRTALQHEKEAFSIYRQLVSRFLPQTTQRKAALCLKSNQTDDEPLQLTVHEHVFPANQNENQFHPAWR